MFLTFEQSKPHLNSDFVWKSWIWNEPRTKNHLQFFVSMEMKTALGNVVGKSHEVKIIQMNINRRAVKCWFFKARGWKLCLSLRWKCSSFTVARYLVICESMQIRVWRSVTALTFEYASIIQRGWTSWRICCWIESLICLHEDDGGRKNILFLSYSFFIAHTKPI